MGELAGRWWHSFEEDHDDVRVYRPEGFDFPPARGRRGIELRADGTCTEFSLGRADAPEPATGTWQSDAGFERLSIRPTQGPHRVLEVVRREPDLLEVRAVMRRQ